MAQPTSDRNPCPVSLLMNMLSGPWTMYIIWTLSTAGPTRFGALRRQVEGISTKMLTERLRMLEQEGIVHRHYEPTVPPQVTYSLTERAGELVTILDQLNGLAQRWYGDLPSCGASQAQPEALQKATVLL
ncbi:helix-turn-helix domain-containing protein [Leptolyngbya sp. CCNP1308]|uniref:winged helix-turn-helix transcriptional regulator n=1 Tax=Leptolyngbya sp. CCNP1308 TaxID=3110255 RepID=UPI002B1F5972|nr:helix-turn-helix domain-containing protein [Leptolyngbya sp. CCNP1308]MEA5448952.1 helix-turn-helix domain-containing protein [Leptolyngbya sp. CCNP1308]